MTKEKDKRDRPAHGVRIEGSDNHSSPNDEWNGMESK